MIVKVQGRDGNIHTVDLGQSICSCGRKSCEHLGAATDVFLSHGRRLRFSIISASHKTARTSSISWAWPWAETFASISGWDKVAAYFGKAIFEESRNIRLWAQIKNLELNPKEQVRAFILSRKKWECLPGMTDHMTHWINAHALFQFNSMTWCESKLRQRIKKFSSIEEGYEAWFFIKQKKQFRQAFWDELSDRADRERNERLRWFLRHQPSTGYDCMVGLEIALGLFDKEAEESHPDTENVESYVPAFSEAYEDVHCYSGRRRFIRWFPKLLEGKLPIDSDLRLMLSGQIWGCAWRYAAFNQKGRIMQSPGKLIPWNDVRLEQEGREIAWLDSLFYRSTYESLGKQGEWKPPTITSPLRNLNAGDTIDQMASKKP